MSNLAVTVPKWPKSTISSQPHSEGTVYLVDLLLKYSNTSLTIFLSLASSIPSVPGELLTSNMYGGLFSVSSDGIKSTAVNNPLIALAALRHCSISKSVKSYDLTLAPCE